MIIYPAMKKKPKFKKFEDGWWIVIFYVCHDGWGKWRGPFITKADAEIDCMNSRQFKEFEDSL